MPWDEAACWSILQGCVYDHQKRMMMARWCYWAVPSRRWGSSQEVELHIQQQSAFVPSCQILRKNWRNALQVEQNIRVVESENQAYHLKQGGRRLLIDSVIPASVRQKMTKVFFLNAWFWCFWCVCRLWDSWDCWAQNTCHRCTHVEGDDDPEMTPKEPKLAFPVDCAA